MRIRSKGARVGVMAWLAAAATGTVGAAGTLESCRAMVDSTARLACYDAIPLPAAATAAPAATRPGATAGAVTAVPAAGAATVSPSAGAAAAAAPGTSATTAGSAAAPAVTAADSFGLERSAAAADDLRSHMPGSFTGWEGRARFTLANGQVWEVIDGSRAVYNPIVNPPVHITRGVLGTFFMKIEGVAQTPRVRRIR